MYPWWYGDISFDPWNVLNCQDDNGLDIILPEVLHSLGSHAIAASCFLMRNGTSLCSSVHKKPDGLMFIFSICSLVKFSEDVKSGGCISRSGSERRGLDRMWRIQYYLGRVVHMGCTWFAAFLYLATAKASKGGPGCGRG